MRNITMHMLPESIFCDAYHRTLGSSQIGTPASASTDLRSFWTLTDRSSKTCCREWSASEKTMRVRATWFACDPNSLVVLGHHFSDASCVRLSEPLYAKIDRPEGIASFIKPVPVEETLSGWLSFPLIKCVWWMSFRHRIVCRYNQQTNCRIIQNNTIQVFFHRLTMQIGHQTFQVSWSLSKARSFWLIKR